MTDPTMQAAVISGAVAGTAIVGSIVTTWLTLRHQRKTEDERRRHERHIRLLESGLKAAVDFLAAADRATRARQTLDTARISLDRAKSSSDQQYQQFLTNVQEAQESASTAVADAETAYTAVRMLIPSVAKQGRRYLDFCIEANLHPDTTKIDRERARQMVEETIQRGFGGDLPTDWMSAAPAQESSRSRQWKRRQRA